MEDDVVVVDDAEERNVAPVSVDPIPLADYPEETNYISDYNTVEQDSEYNAVEENSDNSAVEENSDYNEVADYEYTDKASDVAVTGGDEDVDGDVGSGAGVVDALVDVFDVVESTKYPYNFGGTRS